MDSYDQLQTDVLYLAGQKRDFATARACIEAFAATAEGVDTGRVMWLRGSVLLEEGHIGAAIANFHGAADRLTADPRLLAACLLECGSLANQTGDMAAAEAAGDRLFALAEQFPEARSVVEVMYGIRGDACYLRGDILGAIEWYKRAIRQLEDPCANSLPVGQRLCTMALHWHSLARCYLALGDLVRVRFAIEGVRQCRHADLQGLAAYDEFRICLHMGALPEAGRWLAEAERLIRNPQNRQYVLLGQIWLARAQDEEAMAQRALERLHSEHELILYEVQNELSNMKVKEGVK